MEKKNTSPTVAEQKQEFLLPKSANVFKSGLLRAAREIFTDEMNVCASCLMSAYTSLEKLNVRNTSVFLLEKEESHV